MKNFHQQLRKTAQKTIAEDGRWLSGVSAIVADNDDPEHQHRVRVIIPSIDEDLIYDEWIRQFVFCLGNGFGSAFIPPKGAEVILFGELGQKYSLFYASVYNEEMFVPEGFNDEMTVGVKAPGNLYLLAVEVAKVLAQNIEINADQLAKFLGSNVIIQADQLTELKGNKVTASADDEMKIEGGKITIAGDGTISITGGNITISGSSVKIHNRIVNPAGPAI